MPSYLTQDELTALQSTDLHRKSVFLARDISMSFFSVARYYGGARIDGYQYTYMPDSDELVRDDVVKWVTKRRKAEKKAAKPKAPVDTQTELFN